MRKIRVRCRCRTLGRQNSCGEVRQLTASIPDVAIGLIVTAYRGNKRPASFLLRRYQGRGFDIRSTKNLLTRNRLVAIIHLYHVVLSQFAITFVSCARGAGYAQRCVQS